MYVLLMLMKPEILIDASGCIIDMPHRKCELLDMDRKAQMSFCQDVKDPAARFIDKVLCVAGSLEISGTLEAGIRRMLFSISSG